MNTMCKARVPRERIIPAVNRALHSEPRLSTASADPAVQTVGNLVPNSAQITGLPTFPFLGTLFSKTGMTTIPARRLVSTPLSTFPVPTVTTTKKEMDIFCLSSQ
jgi:hypothetical protein